MFKRLLAGKLKGCTVKKHENTNTWIFEAKKVKTLSVPLDYSLLKVFL